MHFDRGSKTLFVSPKTHLDILANNRRFSRQLMSIGRYMHHFSCTVIRIQLKPGSGEDALLVEERRISTDAYV